MQDPFWKLLHPSTQDICLTTSMISGRFHNNVLFPAQSLCHSLPVSSQPSFPKKMTWLNPSSFSFVYTQTLADKLDCTPKFHPTLNKWTQCKIYLVKEVFQVMKGKDLHPRLLYPVKLSFRMEGKIKCFSDKVKFKEFIIIKPLLYEMLKGLT